eukprot:1145072-Pelagomonas_calceolata.AAC.4
MAALIVVCIHYVHCHQWPGAPKTNVCMRVHLALFLVGHYTSVSACRACLGMNFVVGESYRVWTDVAPFPTLMRGVFHCLCCFISSSPNAPLQGASVEEITEKVFHGAAKVKTLKKLWKPHMGRAQFEDSTTRLLNSVLLTQVLRAVREGRRTAQAALLDS